MAVWLKAVALLVVCSGHRAAAQVLRASCMGDVTEPWHSIVVTPLVPGSDKYRIKYQGYPGLPLTHWIESVSRIHDYTLTHVSGDLAGLSASFLPGPETLIFSNGAMWRAMPDIYGMYVNRANHADTVTVRKADSMYCNALKFEGTGLRWTNQLHPTVSALGELYLGGHDDAWYDAVRQVIIVQDATTHKYEYYDRVL